MRPLLVQQCIIVQRSVRIASQCWGYRGVRSPTSWADSPALHTNIIWPPPHPSTPTIDISGLVEPDPHLIRCNSSSGLTARIYSEFIHSFICSLIRSLIRSWATYIVIDTTQSWTRCDRTTCFSTSNLTTGLLQLCAYSFTGVNARTAPESPQRLLFDWFMIWDHVNKWHRRCTNFTGYQLQRELSSNSAFWYTMQSMVVHRRIWPNWLLP